MGKKLQKEAKKLGLTNLPKYTFYAQPRKIKWKFSKTKPDIAYELENWMTSNDPSSKMDESMSGSGRSSGYYYIAPGINIYVEVADKTSGRNFRSEDNHVNKVDIYTNNEDHVRAIAKVINAIWDDGMVAHLNFEKFEKKFEVGKKDILSTWNAFL